MTCSEACELAIMKMKLMVMKMLATATTDWSAEMAMVMDAAAQETRITVNMKKKNAATVGFNPAKQRFQHLRTLRTCMQRYIQLILASQFRPLWIWLHPKNSDVRWVSIETAWNENYPSNNYSLSGHFLWLRKALFSWIPLMHGRNPIDSWV